MNARLTVGVVATLLVAGCSSSHEPTAQAPTPASTQAPTPKTAASSRANPLAGTYSTDPIPVAHLVDVARRGGFDKKDVAEFRAGYDGVQDVVYTLKLTDELWVVFESRDGGTATDDWAGPYQILDATTVRAGGPPCGPITYDYELDGDELSLDMTDDQCFEDGKVPAGELIAQTTIYESGPYHRIG
jgi:hypothetical protein